MVKLLPALFLIFSLLVACENPPETPEETTKLPPAAPPTPTNFEEQAKYHLHFLKQSEGYDFLLPQVAPIYQFSFLSGHFYGGHNHPFVYWDPVLKTFMVSWYVTLVNFPETEKDQMRETFETLLANQMFNGIVSERFTKLSVHTNEVNSVLTSTEPDKRLSSTSGVSSSLKIDNNR